MALHVYQVKRRFMAVYAAEMRRHADRAPDVAADTQVSETCCQCRGRPARRSSRGSLYIPRIVGCAINLVVALPIAQPGRNIRRTNQHGPRMPQPRLPLRVARSTGVL